MKYTKEQVEAALEGAVSIKEFLINIGLKVNNGSYTQAKRIVKEFDLELPRYNFSENGEKLRRRNHISDEEWFTEGHRIRSGPPTRKRLIALGVLDQCSICKLGPEWQGKPLTLQVDHINGDRFDNRRENLRIICPNCHSQTTTYGNGMKKREYSYCECGERKSKRSKRCFSCSTKHREGKQLINYPEIGELVKMLKKSNFVKVSEELGCSDNAIRKHLKRNGINPKEL